MSHANSRREFLKRVGLSATVAPFLMNRPSLGFSNQQRRKQRLVILFSPNGVIPETFWPTNTPDGFTLPESLEPLEPYRDQLLSLHGVNDQVRGDGDNHMRGIGCLLTGVELFAGNLQGGSHTPAGWSRGISIDQEIKNFLQQHPASRTRFGSLEQGVLVPERADTWTRISYAGPNKPVAPINDPYQLFQKLYGESKGRESLASVLDTLEEDLAKLKQQMSAEDRHLLDEQTTFVREMEQELQQAAQQTTTHAMPPLEPGIDINNDNMPAISKMQIDLLVNSFANDFARISTLQYTRSVGQARMSWVGIDEKHHSLSHEPDSNIEAREKLTKINRWYCQQVAYLAERLQATPEPGGEGTLLDNTLIVWTNELGKGNNHTLDNTPFVLVGGGLDFQMGRALELDRVSHNRLLMALAGGFGHRMATFGNPDFCAGGPLNLA